MEWQRLEKYLATICKIAHAHKVQVSLDTRHVSVARQAVACGIDWFNDVSHNITADLIELLRNSALKYVLMHSLSVPPSQDEVVSADKHIVAELLRFANEKISLLTSFGIEKERLIFDVGLGFGKTVEQNMSLLKEASCFRSLGVPLLYGHSRKSFFNLSKTASLNELDATTAQYTALLGRSAVDYVRVHNIAFNQKYLATSLQ